MRGLVRIFFILGLLGVLSACGGGGGDDSSSTDDTSNNTDPTPDPVIDENSVVYPDSFPLLNQVVTAEWSKSYDVSGLTPGVDYNVTISGATADIGLFVQDKSAPSTHLCQVSTVSGEGTCTISMLGSSAYISITNSNPNDVTFTLDIAETTEADPGIVDEGSEDAPVVLDFLGGDLPHDGSVMGFGGNSYYQVSNLTPGARYTILITDATEDVSLNVFSDNFTTDAKCDPEYSWQLRCVFTSPGTSATININNIYLSGTYFTLNMTEVSTGDEFEGTWHEPIPLDLVTGDLPHLGKVDGYSSYYALTGMTEGKYYELALTSKVNTTSLEFFDATTGETVYQSCNPDSLSFSSTIDDEACTLQAGADDLYVAVRRSSEDDTNGDFILKLKQMPDSEGEAGAPISLLYSDANPTRHEASVGRTEPSYYHVSGLAPGTEYMITLVGDSLRDAVLGVYGDDSTFTSAISCTQSDTDYCIITSASSELYLAVSPPTNPPGENFYLNVTPVPVSEGPLALNADTELPYEGQVGSGYTSSEYTVSGLTPDTDYVVSMTEVTGSMSMPVWPDTSSTSSEAVNTSAEGGACTVNSGANGVVEGRARSNVDPPGHFLLDFQPAGQLSADYQNTDAVLIPDDDPVGISRLITISDSPVTAISEITVEVNVEHDYTSDLAMYLIAPDGTSVTLLDHRGTSEFINTRFNDYADESILGSPERYNNTIRPTTPLHVLNGLDVNGTWTLKVADDTYVNRSDAIGGKFHSWGISFK